MAGLEGHTVDLLTRAKCGPHCQSRCKRVRCKLGRSDRSRGVCACESARAMRTLPRRAHARDSNGRCRDSESVSRAPVRSPQVGTAV